MTAIGTVYDTDKTAKAIRAYIVKRGGDAYFVSAYHEQVHISAVMPKGGELIGRYNRLALVSEIEEDLTFMGVMA